MNKNVGILIAGIIVIALICGGVYYGVTRNNIGILSDGQKSKSGEMVVNSNDTEEDFVIGEREAFYTDDDYPVVDGSTATIPLAEAFEAEFKAKSVNDVNIKHSTTHPAYERLISGEVDLILVTYPSEEEFKMAEKAGVELEITPVVNEAFVFYNNILNPVKSLTFEQIQKIYTGEITNWKEVGGEDLPIKAYQREPNSGSQTGILKLVMKGLKMMDAPVEDIIGEMFSIISLVSDYDNGKNAIGYSYYYYATTMYDIMDKEIADRIHLLGVNGIEPNNQTIKDGSYPIRTNYYIVINAAEPEGSPARVLKDRMLGERGQKAAEAVGYVGM
ncbi:MAG: substrate-binding domain-containing protein [Clostridia bacterium]|nr:substrate-binding domain-containing protein [Clostridia bacterium]